MKKITLIAALLFSLVLFNSCLPFLPFENFFLEDDEENESPVLKGVSAVCDKETFALGEYCTLTVTGALDKKFTDTEFDIVLYTQKNNSDRQTFRYSEGESAFWIKTTGFWEKLSFDEQKSINRSIKIKPASTGSFYIEFYCSAYNSLEVEYPSYSRKFNITVTE